MEMSLSGGFRKRTDLYLVRISASPPAKCPAFVWNSAADLGGGAGVGCCTARKQDQMLNITY